MDKKQIKQGKRMAKLLDKATKADSVDGALNIVKKEPFYNVDEKHAVVFQLGRIYERQMFEAEIQQQFEQIKKEENDKKNTNPGSV